MNINKEALKGIVEEIEASRARQKAETELQREIMKRCKPHQLEPKAVRIVLQRRAMGDAKREEQDYYVHAYELALGPKKQAADALASGKGVRETARATGLSVGTVSSIKKSVQKSSQLNTPHDPATGEIIETGEVTSLGDDAGHRSEPSAPAEQSVNPVSPPRPSVAIIGCGEGEQPGAHSETEVQAVPPGDGAAPASNDAAGTPSPSIEESCGDEGGPSQPAMRGEASAFVETGGAALAASPQAGVEPGPQDTDPQSAAMDRMVALGQEIDADDLAIPPFLRGSRQRVAA